MPAPAPGRLLIQKLAAHLAFLLDEGQEVVVLAPFRLEQQLLATLTGRSDGGRRYLDGLVGFKLMPVPGEPEEAATRYLELVVRRRLQLARNLAHHKGHELFLLMCRRGVGDGWSGARLQRSSAALIAAGAAGTSSDFAAVAYRLGKLDDTITPGSPATGTRARRGPLWLVVSSHATEVAEELSVWHAVTTGPMRLRKLGSGAKFDRLCSLMIQSLETANAHWSALVSLGLWPPDWLAHVSVNTAKKAAAFIATVREASADGPQRIEVWRRVWEVRTVPGYETADEFWASELGRALRQPHLPPVQVGPDDLPDEDEPLARVLDALEFRQRLDLARREGVLDDYEVWFLSRLSDGATMAELAVATETRRRFAPGEMDLETFAAELSRRLYAFARRMEP